MPTIANEKISFSPVYQIWRNEKNTLYKFGSAIIILNISIHGRGATLTVSSLVTTILAVKLYCLFFLIDTILLLMDNTEFFLEYFTSILRSVTFFSVILI